MNVCFHNLLISCINFLDRTIWVEIEQMPILKNNKLNITVVNYYNSCKKTPVGLKERSTPLFEALASLKELKLHAHIIRTCWVKIL